MRPDMQDVIIDTGRRGSRHVPSRFKKARRFNVTQDEDGSWQYDGALPEGNKVGMRCSGYDGYGWNYKDFGDRLSPLWQFLLRRVGRKADDVYSEFCAQVDARNIRGWHLKDHFDRWFYEHHSLGYHWKGDTKYGFFIKDGILRYTPYPNYSKRWAAERKAKAAETRKGHIIEVKGKLYWRRPDDKLWFEVVAVDELPKFWFGRDTFGFSIKDKQEVVERYGRLVYLIGKRPVSRKQIRDLGLEAALLKNR